MRSTAVPLRIGTGVEGQMDELRIYNLALTPVEVMSLFLLDPMAVSG